MKIRNLIIWIASILLILITARELHILYGLPFRSFTPTEDIERTTLIPDQNASGSAWKRGFDCSFKSPPQELTIKTLDGCESETHNASVMRNASSHYFAPWNQLKNEAPYCLIPYKERLNAVAASRDRQRMYCRRDWSFTDRALFGVGLL